MLHTPILAKADLLLYALYIVWHEIIFAKRVALIKIILRLLIWYNFLLVQEFPLQ